MSFRPVYGLLMAALAVVSLEGCGIKLGAPVFSRARLEMGSNSACLTGAADKIENYFAGKSSETEVSSLLDCASNSLKLFAAKTRGANQGVYTPQELRNFLESYYIRDFKISDSFLSAAMDLKCAFLGGTPGGITDKEIQRATELIAVLKKAALQLLPFFPLSPDRLGDKDPRTFDASLQAIRSVTRMLAASSRGAGNAYSFSQLDALLAELAKIPVSNGSFPAAVHLRDSLPVFRALKPIILGTESEWILPEERGVLLTTFAQWYSAYLQWSYMSRNYHEWYPNPGREYLVRLLEQVSKYFAQALDRHPLRVISFSDLDRLIDAIPPSVLQINARTKVKAETLKDLLRPLVWHVLRAPNENGIGGVALKNLLDGLNRWEEGQKYLEAAFGKLKGSSKDDGSGEYASGDIGMFSLTELFPNPSERTLQLQNARDWINWIVANARPLFKPDSLEISFEGYPDERRFSFHQLSVLNWQHELSYMLGLAYGDGVSDKPEDGLGVKVDGLTQFFNDFRELLIELRLVSPTQPNLPQKRFFEANLFTFAGDGDSRMSVHEGAELLGYMISAESIANRIYRNFENSECRTNEPDPYGEYLLDRTCFRDRFFGGLDRFLANMPRFYGYYSRLSPEDQENFRHVYETVSRTGGYSETDVGIADIQGFLMVAHYVETIFAKFDLDFSGTLDLDEAAKAFPDFRYSLYQIVLKKTGSPASDKRLFAIFTYLLDHGHEPSGFEYARWLVMKPFWTVSADRLKILEIFKSFAQAK